MGSERKRGSLFCVRFLYFLFLIRKNGPDEGHCYCCFSCLTQSQCHRVGMGPRIAPFQRRSACILLPSRNDFFPSRDLWFWNGCTRAFEPVTLVHHSKAIRSIIADLGWTGALFSALLVLERRVWYTSGYSWLNHNCSFRARWKCSLNTKPQSPGFSS